MGDSKDSKLEDMDTTNVDETSHEISPPNELKPLETRKGQPDIEDDRPPSPLGADDNLTQFVKAECMRQAVGRTAAPGGGDIGVGLHDEVDANRMEGFFTSAYAAISRMQTETRRVNAGRERLARENKNPETGIWEEEMQAWHLHYALKI